MSVDFSLEACQSKSNKKLFGLCDDQPPPHKPAYIDETDGAKWIAVVDNYYEYEVTFTAIDHCIPIVLADGVMSKRCDGMLSYNDTVVFVELKQRAQLGSNWIIDAELQLRTTIDHFKASEQAGSFKSKRAYAANSEHPRFRTNQSERMNKFYNDTGFILRIENRIRLQ